MQTRRLALPSAAALAALLLTGCAGPAEPEWTPPPASPEPSASESGAAPVDQDAAWIAAESAVQDYLTVQYEVYAASGEGAERLAAVASDDEYAHSTEIARQLGEIGARVEGAPTFDADAGAAEFAVLQLADGSTLENGTVRVPGCYDATAQNAFAADGTAAPVAEERTVEITYTVRFLPDSGSWVVADRQEGLAC